MKTSDISDEVILDAVRRYHISKGTGPTPDVSLPYPQKLILSKMQKMVNKGILDYGVSLRTAWVVRKIK